MKMREMLLTVALVSCAGCMPSHKDAGSLAIMELGYKDGTKTVSLPNDYGFLVQRLDDQPLRLRLYLYDKSAGTIRMTGDFSVFLEGLQGFPDGVKVDWIRGCGIAGALPEDYNDRLDAVVKRKRFCLTDETDGNFPVCSCETAYVKVFETANQSIQPAQ